MAKLQVTPAAAFTEYSELNFQGLYLHHMFWNSPKANQAEIIQNKAPIGIGNTVVNNWSVYDGPGENAKLVARAQGLHTYAGNWHNSFTLVFVDERFSGSTLEVMGIVVETGEWAVVGGTGQFAMANGVISKKTHKSTSDGNIIELTIRAFYPKLKGTTVPAPTKRGPWGGNGGSLHEMVGKSKRLESVTINHGGVVHAIGFSYIDEDGQIKNAGIWGEYLTHPSYDKTETIKFGPSEFVKQITGTGVRGTAPIVYLTNFQIVTNQKTYGPFGAWQGNDTSFSYTVPEGETVVGFFTNSSDRVYKIGLYTI